MDVNTKKNSGSYHIMRKAMPEEMWIFRGIGDADKIHFQRAAEYNMSR